MHPHTRIHTRPHTHTCACTHTHPLLCRKRTTLEKRQMKARVHWDHRPSTHWPSLLLLALGPVSSRVIWTNWQWQLLLLTLCRWPSQIVSPWNGKLGDAVSSLLQTLRTLMVPGDIVLETNKTNPSLGKMNVQFKIHRLASCEQGRIWHASLK